MTIDEAIERERKSSIHDYEMKDVYTDDNGLYAKECAYYNHEGMYHEQLAEWLDDYKQLTEYTSTEPYIRGYNKAIDECIRKINEITCGCTQEVWSHTICNVLEELKGAKE